MKKIKFSWLLLAFCAILAAMIHIYLANILLANKSKADNFFNDAPKLTKYRDTDIIKFKIELKNAIEESYKLNTSNEVKMKLDTFFNNIKTDYKPFLYNIEVKEDDTGFQVMLNVYFDSYKLESYNILKTK
jgi:hypothetical protein